MSFVFDHGDGQAGQTTQPVTLKLRISVSTNRTSTNIPPNIPTKGVKNPADATPNLTVVTDSRVPDQSTNLKHPLHPPDYFPIQSVTPVPQDRGEASLIEKAQVSLDRADELEKSIDRSDTWEGVVGRIKWVMDSVSPVAGVRVIFVSPLLD